MFLYSKDFFAPAREYRKRYVGTLVIPGIWMGIYAVFTVILIERATQSLELGDTKQLTYILMWMSVLFLSVFINKFSVKIFMFKMIHLSSYFMDKVYLKKFLYANNNAVEKIGIGRILSVYQKGTFIRMDLLIEVFFTIPRTLVVLGFSLREISKHGREVGLIGACVICGVTVWIVSFWRRIGYRRRKGKDIVVETDRLKTKRFMSKFEILQQNRYSSEIAHKLRLSEEWFGYKRMEKMYQGFAYDGGVLILNALLIFIVGWCGYGVMKGQFMYSDFVLFSGLTLLLRREISKLLEQAKKFGDNRVHIEKFGDMFEQMGKMEGYEEGDAFKYSGKNIAIHNISYGYTGHANVFSDFSLTVLGGKKTALVGISGSGKTTLVKLIAGYIRPDRGSIRVDGQDLTEVSLKSYYANIGYLTQEPSVFDGTIRENLMYAVQEDDLGASETLHEKIAHVISLAKCEFIYGFADGLDTEIGERGIRLSGGQRQRLAIAKVFLKDPKILILDEPTSALDSFSEEAITEAMHNLFAGRTVIIIAHRLQTVKQADDIVVLEQGEIIERGTHDELVGKGGHYAKMLELQSGF